MKKLVFHLLSSLIAVLLSDYFNIIDFNVTSRQEYFKIILIFLLLFGFLNMTVKPLLKMLSLPMLFLTLGLFSIVINAIILFLATYFIPEVHVQWWEGYLIVPCVFSILHWLTHRMFD